MLGVTSDKFRENNQATTSRTIITGEQFSNILRDANLGFPERDIDCLTRFAIKGSKRAAPPRMGEEEEAVSHGARRTDLQHELIHVPNLLRSLDVVIEHLKREDRSSGRGDALGERDKFFRDLE